MKSLCAKEALRTLDGSRFPAPPRPVVRSVTVRAASVLAAVVALAAAVAPARGSDDPWQRLRPLLGSWEGTGAGFSGKSEVSHEWQFVLGGKFLRLRTRSVAIGDDGTEEVHEDVGYVSLDTGRGTFVFRQFLSEGYVNTFDVTVRAGEMRGVDFAYRDGESTGGVRARMRLNFTGDDEYDMVLDLAFPGKEFAACQENRMRRVVSAP